MQVFQNTKANKIKNLNKRNKREIMHLDLVIQKVGDETIDCKIIQVKHLWVNLQKKKKKRIRKSKKMRGERQRRWRHEDSWC